MNAHDILFPDDPYRREHEQQRAEIARERDERARQRTQSQQIAPGSDDFWGHVDARIEQKGDVILEAVGEALGQLFDKEQASIQAALDKRDHAIQALRDEVEIKIGLGRKLAKLKAEVEQARQQAPSFKSELESLRKQVVRQEKIISRLRGEQSQLAFAQQQLDAEQQKGRREITLTAVQLTAFGEQTREVLQRLRESGADFFDEWGPSGLSSVSARGGRARRKHARGKISRCRSRQ
jgi:chromosome segregation ATPase